MQGSGLFGDLRTLSRGLLALLTLAPVGGEGIWEFGQEETGTSWSSSETVACWELDQARRGGKVEAEGPPHPAPDAQQAACQSAPLSLARSWMVVGGF